MILDQTLNAMKKVLTAEKTEMMAIASG